MAKVKLYSFMIDPGIHKRYRTLVAAGHLRPNYLPNKLRETFVQVVWEAERNAGMAEKSRKYMAQTDDNSIRNNEAAPTESTTSLKQNSIDTTSAAQQGVSGGT